MNREKREQISNRLVNTFGVLLIGALAMLYVRSFIFTKYANIVYIIVLIAGILAALSAATLFVLSKSKETKLKNYLPVPCGVFVAALLLYLSKFNLFGFYTKTIAIYSVFALMIVYFVVLTIYTAIMLKKPVKKEKPNKKKNNK